MFIMQCKRYAVVTLAVLGMSMAMPASADSERLVFSGTKNVYQRIDDPVNWLQAKAACEDKGGYLVTITSEKEQQFVYETLMESGNAVPNAAFFIGATDAKKEGVWKWVTNEKVNYSNWHSGQPSNDNGSGHYGEIYSVGSWNDIPATTVRPGYICEWSALQRKGTISLPDINGNNHTELVNTYVQSKNRKVWTRIVDGKTGKKLKVIEFGRAGVKPVAVAALKDMNGNQQPEIAMLYTDGPNDWLEIRDTKSKAILKKHYVQSAKKYAALSMAAMQDSNANGAQELLMQSEARNSVYKPSQLMVMDAASGAVLNQLDF